MSTTTIPHEMMSHIIFLSEVVLTGKKKKKVMADTLHLLLYLVKSMQDIEIPTSVSLELKELMDQIEQELKEENIKISERRQKRKKAIAP